MSIVSYAPTPRSVAPASADEGAWLRLYHRFLAYRQAQAFAELRRHSLLLPHELERAGWKINERSEDSLPFIR